MSEHTAQEWWAAEDPPELDRAVAAAESAWQTGGGDPWSDYTPPRVDVRVGATDANGEPVL